MIEEKIVEERENEFKGIKTWSVTKKHKEEEIRRNTKKKK